MTALRHNPYVGSFHGMRMPTSNTEVFFQDESVDKAGPSTSELGLKRILYQKDVGKPVLSQLKVSRVSTSFPVKRSFLASLKKIPLKVYSTSGGSKSSLSYHGDDPICAICIEPYVDGDQLMTLSCSHCFHKECARKWFLQGCLNNTDSSVNCPECRQQHQDHQQQQAAQQQQGRAHDAVSVVSGVEEISSASFFDVGNKLINEGGYDFMSDIGSETSRTTRSHSLANLDQIKETPAAATTSAVAPTVSMLQEELSQLAVSEIVPSIDETASVAATVPVSISSDAAVSSSSSSSSMAYSSSDSSAAPTTSSVSPTPQTAETETSAVAEADVQNSCEITSIDVPVAALASVLVDEAITEDVGYTLVESSFSDCGYPLQMIPSKAIPLNI